MLLYIEPIGDRLYAIEEQAGFYILHALWLDEIDSFPVASLEDGIEYISATHPPKIIKRRALKMAGYYTVAWASPSMFVDVICGAQIGSWFAMSWLSIMVILMQPFLKSAIVQAWLRDVPSQRLTKEPMFDVLAGWDGHRRSDCQC